MICDFKKSISASCIPSETRSMAPYMGEAFILDSTTQYGHLDFPRTAIQNTRHKLAHYMGDMLIPISRNNYARLVFPRTCFSRAQHRSWRPIGRQFIRSFLEFNMRIWQYVKLRGINMRPIGLHSICASSMPSDNYSNTKDKWTPYTAKCLSRYQEMNMRILRSL